MKRKHRESYIWKYYFLSPSPSPNSHFATRDSEVLICKRYLIIVFNDYIPALCMSQGSLVKVQSGVCGGGGGGGG